MKKFTAIIIAINLLLLPVSAIPARAYWVWTPETKKFVNPKYAVKDTPKEQYDWAMNFYDAKDYKGAAIEFEKLVKNYEYSEYAAKAQYYTGLSYDNQGKYYIAFQNYQKAVDNFPHVGNIDEIIAREFEIGGMYAAKKNPKVLGTDIMTSFDRAIEIYKKVVDNAPFGKLADEAQFRMAAAMKEAGRYDEATLAFQKIVDDYPASKLYEKARYEMANSAYKASLQPAYDSAPSDKALKAFEEFAGANADESLTKEAQATIKRLKDKAAEKSFITAEFYETQKRYASATIYYQDVINRYPDSASAEISRRRIEDFKNGNYSHKKDFKERKKNNAVEITPQSMPITVGEKQEAKPEKAAAPKDKTKKDWTPLNFDKKEARAKVEAKADVKAKANADVKVKEEAAQGVKPAESVKTSAGKRWWAFGLDEVPGEKIEKPVKAPAIKGWMTFDTDKKKAKAKAKAEAKVEAKTEKPDVKDKVKKGWTPLNFDKKKEGTKKDE